MARSGSRGQLASLLMWAAALGVPGAQASLWSSEPSPCADRVGAWLTEPKAFIRKDQPKRLEGLHVACAWKDQHGSLQLEAYRDGVLTESPLRTKLVGTAEASWKDFRESLKQALKISKKTNNWGHLELKQPFGIFSEMGHRLRSTEEALEAGLFLIFEGGQWFWPPVKVGYVRKLPGTEFELETLSVQPVLYRVRGFLQTSECDELVSLGQGRMVNSPVSLMDKDKGKEAKEFRTSTQARVFATESEKLQAIEKRIANLTRVPIAHNEEVQILRYQKTQYYSAHLDNWDPAYYKDSGHMLEYGHTNRQITVFWYLTDVKNGGETLFPRGLGLPQPHDMYSCEKGLKVKPEKGAVILWYSLHPNGNTDPNGLHSACPVQEGEKWSANYWVWNKPRDMRLKKRMPDMELEEGYEEDEEDEDEEDEGPVPAQHVRATVTFENSGADTVHLFWFNPSSNEEVALGDIPPNSDSTMNSFHGHTWHVRAGPDSSSKLLHKFVVGPKQDKRFVIGNAEL